MVLATLHYLDPELSEKPYSWLGKPPAGVAETNIKPWPVETEICDVRGRENDFTVDRQGFQYVKHESKHVGALDTKEGIDAYYTETEQLLLRTLPGAKRVKLFNWTVRKTGDLSGSARAPVSRAHVDNSPASGARRVLSEMGEEGEALSKGRCQIINVWRPIVNPAYDCPLAVMDYHSLSWDDLKTTDLVLSNEGGRKGENLSLLANAEQKWYFLSEQAPDEPSAAVHP